MMSLFPADQPLSRTWSMVTQMAWETAKVSRPSSLLSFLLYPIPPSTIPLFPVNSGSLFSRPSVSFFAAVTFFLPRLFRPHNPLFQPLPSICPFRLPSSSVLPPAVSLVPRSIECCVHLGKDWVHSCNLKTFSETQGKDLTCEHRAHFETQNKSASKVLKGLFYPTMYIWSFHVQNNCLDSSTVLILCWAAQFARETSKQFDLKSLIVVHFISISTVYSE